MGIKSYLVILIWQAAMLLSCDSQRGNKRLDVVMINATDDKITEAELLPGDWINFAPGASASMAAIAPLETATYEAKWIAGDTTRSATVSLDRRVLEGGGALFIGITPSDIVTDYGSYSVYQLDAEDYQRLIRSGKKHKVKESVQMRHDDSPATNRLQ